MNRLIYLIAPLSLLLGACSDSDSLKVVSYRKHIVVEGEIRNGEFPRVSLTYSAPLDIDKDSLSLLDYLIKDAKVIVSSGERSEVLRPQANFTKLPPFEYVGSQLKGEVGKEYQLRIEHKEKVLTATTYIPKPVGLDSIWFTKLAPSDTVGYLNISFINSSDDCYQIATRVQDKEFVFTPALYGNLMNDITGRGELFRYQVNKGPVVLPKTNFTTHYNEKDSVELMFNTQPYSAYQFWSSFQNEILNSQNPLFPAQTSLKSNISGGIGVWAGYGTFIYKVGLANSTATLEGNREYK